MNNAELLLQTARENGVEICFSNFGTTEIPLTAAFDTINGVKPVMALFEGVCAGAADGWGRMKGKPAMTLLHLGPGLANAISTLHDARRAGTPIFNLVGEHMSWHVPADPPLAMNIEALAGTIPGWYRTIKDPGGVAADTARAIGESRYGQIATLIIPNDIQMAEAKDRSIPVYETELESIDRNNIREALKILTSGKKAGLMLGGKALQAEGLRIAARIKEKCGCDLLSPVFPPRLERGGSLPVLKRLPYFAESEAEFLKRYEALVFAGAKMPVAFFGREGIDSYLGAREKETVQLSGFKQNVIEALEMLAEALNAPKYREPAEIFSDPPMPDGKLTGETASKTLAAVQPEGAIIVDEGLSSGMPYYAASMDCPPHTLLTIVGGALGYGMPCAIGAAEASPDRPVISLQADGSAMYTVQALWTQAREKLDITTLILSNRKYGILGVEMERAGVKPGPNTRSLMDITNPDIDWVKLAESMGVPARAVTDTKDLAEGITDSLKEGGPHLIEMKLE